MGLTPVAVTVLENEILNCHLPIDNPGMEQMDKYDLRFWLLGWATMHEWEWHYRDSMTWRLTKSGVEVVLRLSALGLEIVARDRVRMIETRA